MYNIHIRPYQPKDQPQIEKLVHDTVQMIVRRDYTQEQVDIWIDQGIKNRISKPLDKSHAYIAEIDDRIVGFGDITSEGYLDRLYVHKDFQRCGIASQLLKALEAKAIELHVKEIVVDASITAKPFFQNKGYLVKVQQKTLIKDVSFINFKMTKTLTFL